VSPDAPKSAEFVSRAVPEKVRNGTDASRRRGTGVLIITQTATCSVPFVKIGDATTTFARG
jgi:hypothetical protein